MRTKIEHFKKQAEALPVTILLMLGSDKWLIGFRLKLSLT